MTRERDGHAAQAARAQQMQTAIEVVTRAVASARKFADRDDEDGPYWERQARGYETALAALPQTWQPSATVAEATTDLNCAIEDYAINYHNSGLMPTTRKAMLDARDALIAAVRAEEKRRENGAS